MLHSSDSLDIQTLRARLYSGSLRATDVVNAVLARIAARADDKVWIHRLGADLLLERAQQLEQRGPAGLPLYGIPFAIKDNLDLAGHLTTAACPDYAYTAAATALAVQALIDAGALLIGKTNLDQFATGLVGTRSPYGACANSFDRRYISGGSSSGSAIAVATGLVSFSLGTDTAGSGRIPAAFNNIVGLKPSRGLLSSRGMVSACRSLDCISIFATTVADAAAVFDAAAQFDRADPYSRPRRAAVLPRSWRACRIGVPASDQLEFFGDQESRQQFDWAVSQLEQLGARRVAIDFAPFASAARLLYDGPWVAERYLAIRQFIEQQPDSLLPVTRQIISAGAKLSAADCFAAHYRLQQLLRDTEPIWDQIDVLVTPTAGTMYTLDQLQAEPIQLNSNLGYYTNFVNLMDLSALAVPAGVMGNGLPFGITLVAPAFQDQGLCILGDAAHRVLATSLGATGLPLAATQALTASDDGDSDRTATVRLAVCGAHMSGLPLNGQLTTRGATLLHRCKTASRYRLFALNGFTPPRPGMIKVAAGHAIEVEVWSVPAHAFGSFVDGIPPPLAIGTVELEDGEQLRGFICEAYATEGATDISALGGWRKFIAASGSASDSPG